MVKNKLKSDLKEVAIQLIKSSEKSPLLAHALTQAPLIAGMMLTAKDLTWSMTKGLVSTSSDHFNVLAAAFVAQNELADIHARKGKEAWEGLADIIKAARG